MPRSRRRKGLCLHACMHTWVSTGQYRRTAFSQLHRLSCSRSSVGLSRSQRCRPSQPSSLRCCRRGQPGCPPPAAAELPLLLPPPPLPPTPPSLPLLPRLSNRLSPRLRHSLRSSSSRLGHCRRGGGGQDDMGWHWWQNSSSTPGHMQQKMSPLPPTKHNKPYTYTQRRPLRRRRPPAASGLRAGAARSTAGGARHGSAA